MLLLNIKMAALHFNTIGIPRQTIKCKESCIFEIFVPLITILCMLGLKILELFLHVS